MNTPRRQCGITLIELMLGMAIGLVIVAAALASFSQQLRENRSLLLEARLMQDLRATSDLIARDLRRAGHWREAGNGVWRADTTAVSTNPNIQLLSGSVNRIAYSRDVDGASSDETLAYRLRNGVIDMQWGGGSWQAMTDINTMVVTTLSVAPHTQEIELRDFCSQPCPPDSTLSCPPRQQLRGITLQIVARAPNDASVVRQVQAEVRLRNDALTGSCPT